MARQIRALVAHDETVTAALIGAHIPDDAGIELAEIVPTLHSSQETLRRFDADVLLVACREGSTDALELVQWWHSVRVGRPVVVLSNGSDPGFVQQAFAAGADDLVVLQPGPAVPEQNRREVEFSILKAVARSAGTGDRAPDAGTLICIFGSKGGVGKTMTSTNLAVAIAQRGRRTALVDLDLQFGDVMLALGLNPERTIFDLAVSGGSLDSDKLDDFLLRHPSGLRVLAAPTRPDQAVNIEASFVADIYSLLREEYEFVVVDTPPAFTPEVIATMDAATWVCMVGMVDALSLKNTRIGLDTIELMGHPSESVRLVLNRSGTHVGITEKDAITILGRTPDVFIPSDPKITRSVNEGIPIVLSQPRSDAARALQWLADQFVQSPDMAPLKMDSKPGRNRSLFRRRRSTVPASETAGGR
jgi:pilus assembly protein CpaE